MQPFLETILIFFMPLVYAGIVGMGARFGQFKVRAPLFWVWIFYGYAFFSELVCSILYLQKIETHSIYNLYILLSFGFYIFWLLHSISKSRIVLLIVSSIFAIGFACEFFFSDHDFLRNSLLLHNLGILVGSLLYFRSLLLSDSVIGFTQIPNFWFFTGLLFYYLGVVPAIVFQDELMQFNDSFYDWILRGLLMVQAVFIVKAFAVANKKI